MPELIALDYSPWSEKARWALDHHGIDYRETQYLIMLGEPWLRWKLRRPFGKVTVPSLVAGDRVYCDSLEIARYAEWFGSGTPLFSEDVSVIEEWNARSERGLAAGRVLGTERMAEDGVALQENLPGFVPRTVRPAMRPVASIAIAYLRRKHGFDHVARAETYLEETLRQLREGLAGGRYLTRELSYADIAMAAVLGFVKPVDDRYVRLGPATRRCWTHDRLAEEYADLIAWRDELYARHRR